MHLTNFPADQLATALPLVLPQFVIGTILGYTRVHYGLWASVLLHMLHNGAIIALVLAASSAACPDLDRGIAGADHQHRAGVADHLVVEIDPDHRIAAARAAFGLQFLDRLLARFGRIRS